MSDKTTWKDKREIVGKNNGKKKKICTGLRNDGKTEKFGRKSRNFEAPFVIVNSQFCEVTFW